MSEAAEAVSSVSRRAGYSVPGQLRLLCAIIWMGSLWTIGFVVAPVLFSSLADKALAGLIAGRLFHIEAWIGIACAVLILVFTLMNRVGATPEPTILNRRIIRLCCFMVILVVAGYFAVQPTMTHLRSLASADGVMPPDVRHRFGILHLWSTVMYGLQSLTGLILLYSLQRASNVQRR